MSWQQLNADIQAEMHGVSERLKNAHSGEGLDFIILVLPFATTDMQHLGTEHRATLEKRMAHAASDAYTTYMKEDHVPKR